eukprot:jgi/Mesvir1/2202/Mv09847-RA.1
MGPSARTSLFLLIVFAVLLQIASGDVSRRPVPNDGSVHTVFSTECNNYFDWQSAGVFYSHKKSGQPGPVTRLVACDANQAKTWKGADIGPSYVHPNYAVHPVTKDVYSPYNKPYSILHWLQNDPPSTEFVIFMDADMTIRKPLIPRELGAEKGRPVSAHYGYLVGTKNGLAENFLPKEKLKFLDQVGGFIIMHVEDLLKVAPLWLQYTEKVRQNPQLYWSIDGSIPKDLDTGDVYVRRGDPPWISEMYGYVFACADAEVKHIENPYLMLYPEYVPSHEPHILHYGILATLQVKTGKPYQFDKHWHQHKDIHVCPPPFFPPPPPQEMQQPKQGLKREADLLLVECMVVLNEALCEYARRSCPQPEDVLCPPSYEQLGLPSIEKRREAYTSSLPSGASCVDLHAQCEGWAASGECQRNMDYMYSSCPRACKQCAATDKPPTTPSPDAATTPAVNPVVTSGSEGATKAGAVDVGSAKVAVTVPAVTPNVMVPRESSSKDRLAALKDQIAMKNALARAAAATSPGGATTGSAKQWATNPGGEVAGTLWHPSTGQAHGNSMSLAQARKAVAGGGAGAKRAEGREGGEGGGEGGGQGGTWAEELPRGLDNGEGSKRPGSQRGDVGRSSEVAPSTHAPVLPGHRNWDDREEEDGEENVARPSLVTITSLAAAEETLAHGHPGEAADGEAGFVIIVRTGPWLERLQPVAVPGSLGVLAAVVLLLLLRRRRAARTHRRYTGEKLKDTHRQQKEDSEAIVSTSMATGGGGTVLVRGGSRANMGSSR